MLHRRCRGRLLFSMTSTLASCKTHFRSFAYPPLVCQPDEGRIPLVMGAPTFLRPENVRCFVPQHDRDLAHPGNCSMLPRRCRGRLLFSMTTRFGILQNPLPVIRIPTSGLS